MSTHDRGVVRRCGGIEIRSRLHPYNLDTWRRMQRKRAAQKEPPVPIVPRPPARQLGDDPGLIRRLGGVEPHPGVVATVDGKPAYIMSDSPEPIHQLTGVSLESELEHHTQADWVESYRRPTCPKESLMSELITHDLSDERWREYDLPGRAEPYRIEDPKQLVLREGGTTHRVVDGKGIVHCLPAPTAANGCVLRWQPRNLDTPVQF